MLRDPRRTARLTLVVIVLATFCGAASLHAATYYVAQEAANSSDENAGSEDQPWKTLAHACAQAKKGDTVLVKAGVYHETLEPTSDGVTFRVSGDDAVVIARPKGTVIDSASWSLVPGRKSVYQCKAETKGTMVRVDGLALQFEKVQGVKISADPGSGQTFAEPVDRQLEDTDERRWTTLGDGMLLINLGGANPAEHRVELVQDPFTGINLTTEGARVQGFDVIDATTGIALGGQRNVVEDCVVRGADGGAGLRGFANILRRCSLLQCWQGINCGDNPGAQVMEENFIIGTGHPMLQNRPPETDLNSPWGPRCSIRFGNVNFCVLRYNVVADGVWAGWWPDVNCYSTYCYGNVMWRISDRGIYNEYPSNDSRILYNAITHCWDGITFRFCWRTMTMYNYLADNTNTNIGIWAPHVDNPYIFDNVIAKNFMTGAQRYLSFDDNGGARENLPADWPGEGKISPSGRYRLESNIVCNNLYRGQPGECFHKFNGVKFPTLEAYQKATGLDRGSRVDDNARLEDLSLGLYTVRVPESAHPYEAVAVVGNPVLQGIHNDPLPVAGEDAPYFWTQGDADRPRGGEWWGGVFAYTYEWPHFQKPVRRLIRAKDGADPSERLKPGDDPQVWLACEGHPDDNIRKRTPKEGSGFWSPSLPTVPGARITVKFRLQGEKIEPEAPDGGPVVLIRFQSLTGQHVVNKTLLGRTAEGEAIGGGPLVGDFPWRSVETTAEAPETAKRFSVFLGLKPAKGTVCYGGIYIATDPAAAPEAKEPPQETTYEPVKLDAFANRDLDKDTGAPAGAPPGDDFARDYCGLPIIDLSSVKAGQYKAGEIPFEVGRAISLRCFRRPPASLSLSVDNIPIGAKVKSLCFLHAGPFQMGRQEYWRYIVHYADGQRVEVVPVESIGDLDSRQPYFLPDIESMGAAVRIPDEVDGVGYVMRWINPRPDVEVKAVDFRSMDAGQAVLLGITAGR